MNENSSVSVSNDLVDIKLFNSAIYAKIEKAKKPALEFLDKIEIFKKKISTSFEITWAQLRSIFLWTNNTA